MSAAAMLFVLRFAAAGIEIGAARELAPIQRWTSGGPGVALVTGVWADGQTSGVIYSAAIETHPPLFESRDAGASWSEVTDEGNLAPIAVRLFGRPVAGRRSLCLERRLPRESLLLLRGHAPANVRRRYRVGGHSLQSRRRGGLRGGRVRFTDSVRRLRGVSGSAVLVEPHALRNSECRRRTGLGPGVRPGREHHRDRRGSGRPGACTRPTSKRVSS